MIEYSRIRSHVERKREIRKSESYLESMRKLIEALRASGNTSDAENIQREADLMQKDIEYSKTHMPLSDDEINELANAGRKIAYRCIIRLKLRGDYSVEEMGALIGRTGEAAFGMYKRALESTGLVSGLENAKEDDDL